MTNPLNISESDVLAVLPKVLDAPAGEIELGEWVCRANDKSSAQLYGSFGAFHVSGRARVHGIEREWSLFIKATRISTENGTDNPQSSSYQKREFLFYESGFLNHLPAGIAAPRCYATQERDDGAYLMWLEAIEESMPEWTMERYGLAARHLGQFNGAYLCGEPLPQSQPWMSWGRCRQTLQNGIPLLSQADQLAETPLGKRWLHSNLLQRIKSLWAQSHRLSAALERLPVCCCHHDAFRNNLMDRLREDGTRETVAIDWAIAGFGRPGEDAGLLTAISLIFLIVDHGDADLLDEAVFTGYLEGLRDVGWQSDPRLARLGYATAIGVIQGISGTLGILSMIQDPDTVNFVQKLLSRSLDEMIEAWRVTTPFHLDRCEEALALIDELNLD